MVTSSVSVILDGGLYVQMIVYTTRERRTKESCEAFKDGADDIWPQAANVSVIRDWTWSRSHSLRALMKRACRDSNDLPEFIAVYAYSSMYYFLLDFPSADL